MKLQPLRIPCGWKIVINNFTEADPSNYTEKNIDDLYSYFTEDMLYIRAEREIKKNKIKYIKSMAVDLGWYPEGNINGNFGLFLIKDDDWNNPVKELHSKDIQKIINTIEEWLLKYYPN